MIPGGPRRLPARIGIVALNLIMPGLGLLRVQRGRAATLFLAAPWILLTIILIAYRLPPTLSFPAWAALVGLVLIALAAVYIGAMLLSWRGSARLAPPSPWWSRWYGMSGIALLLWALSWPVPDVLHLRYRTFYIPSEAMMPTLVKNDRLVAHMRRPGTMRRGDIVLFRVGAFTYIKRVAALPGDRIAMERGVVVLNGRPVPQRFLRVDRFRPDAYGSAARRLSERFPGEAAPHEIYDRGISPGDDMAERRVAPGHVFVLGDNRDQSADSRYPRERSGVEQLPVRDIVGRALFYLWGPSGRTGEPLGR
jgi:signal peptidase I